MQTRNLTIITLFTMILIAWLQPSPVVWAQKLIEVPMGSTGNVVVSNKARQKVLMNSIDYVEVAKAYQQVFTSMGNMVYNDMDTIDTYAKRDLQNLLTVYTAIAMAARYKIIKNTIWLVVDPAIVGMYIAEIAGSLKHPALILGAAAGFGKNRQTPIDMGTLQATYNAVLVPPAGYVILDNKKIALIELFSRPETKINTDLILKDKNVRIIPISDKVDQVKDVTSKQTQFLAQVIVGIPIEDCQKVWQSNNLQIFYLQPNFLP